MCSGGRPPDQESAFRTRFGCRAGHAAGEACAGRFCLAGGAALATGRGRVVGLGAAGSGHDAAAQSLAGLGALRRDAARRRRQPLSRRRAGFPIGAVLGCRCWLVMGPACASTRCSTCFPGAVGRFRRLPTSRWRSRGSAWQSAVVLPHRHRRLLPVMMNHAPACARRHLSVAARNLGVGQDDKFLHAILLAANASILAGVRIGIGTAFYRRHRSGDDRWSTMTRLPHLR